MWNWFKKRLAPALWRLETEARIEFCEAQLADLRTRFTRFQNRENMRGARSVLARDEELAEQANAILNAPENRASVEKKVNKLDLWKGQH